MEKAFEVVSTSDYRRFPGPLEILLVPQVAVAAIVHAPIELPRGFAVALSRCRTKNATRLRLVYFQAAATASRHVFIAAARKVRCVWADTRWRWRLKRLSRAA